MPSVGPQSPERLVDLLLKQITEGLASSELEELTAFDAAIVAAERRELDAMLAAISFGIVGSSVDAPPTDLRADIERQGLALLANNTFGTASGDASSPLRVSFVRRPVAGWLAAAACLIVAIIGWMRAEHPVVVTSPSAQVQLSLPPPVVTHPVVAPKPRSAAEERDALLARSDTLKVTMAATKDPAAIGVTADIVWDPQVERGFIHLAGLKINDPHAQQYQAWIFDAKRDKRYPISVAIFDVSPDVSDVIIPIQASIPVKSAKAFAVTVEKPGGVVVPDRAHVVVLGAAG